MTLFYTITSYLVYYCNISLLTARVEAGEVNFNESRPRSIAELLNGTFLAVPQSASTSSSTASSFYVQNQIHIVYAVGNHYRAFRYQLEVGTRFNSPRRINLSDFKEVDSLRVRLNGYRWPSALPVRAFGGIVNRSFAAPDVYVVVFVVSGRTTQAGHEEMVRVNTTITVSRRATLQVIVAN